jgi:hypothetical protein
VETPSTFVDTGVLHLPPAADPAAYQALLGEITRLRQFGPGLFNDEAAFRANPKFKGVNPEPGRNLLEKVGAAADFVLQDERVQAALERVLGPRYQVMDAKLVCGVPGEWMPGWVAAMVRENGVKNLGAYMRPEFQDVTYFSGIDFHQDIIDWPDMGPRFITMYVYLDKVGEGDSPLHVLPNSHDFGATVFPHELQPTGTGDWEYRDGRGNGKRVPQVVLTGGPGDVSLWHPFILHGTQPEKNSAPRISVRYLIAAEGASASAGSELAAANARISGPSSLSRTREDLDEAGAAVLKGNVIDGVPGRS